MRTDYVLLARKPSSAVTQRSLAKFYIDRVSKVQRTFKLSCTLSTNTFNMAANVHFGETGSIPRHFEMSQVKNNILPY